MLQVLEEGRKNKVSILGVESLLPFLAWIFRHCKIMIYDHWVYIVITQGRLDINHVRLYWVISVSHLVNEINTC